MVFNAKPKGALRKTLILQNLTCGLTKKGIALERLQILGIGFRHQKGRKVAFNLRPKNRYLVAENLFLKKFFEAKLVHF